MSAKEVLEVIVKSLVPSPEKVKITEKETELGALIEIECDPSERKHIIGRKGRAFRDLLRVVKRVAKKNHKMVFVRIKEEEGGKSGKS